MATLISPNQQQYIDFVASGQIDIEGRRLSYSDFASIINVNRATLYKWQESIPDFWPTVAKRSSELIERRIPRIMNAMFAKALKGDVAAAKLLLAQAGYLGAQQAVGQGITVDSVDFQLL